jgi:carbamoyltransferase
VIVCGLKLTHDGAVAVVEDGRLAFSIEVEKLDNHPRHEPVDDLALVTDVLRSEGCDPSEVDVFVIDGWHAEPGLGTADIELSVAGEPDRLTAAAYHELSATADSTRRHVLHGLPLDGRSRTYVSYNHATDHVFAAYCTSPFAMAGDPSLVLVWDGGMLPLLYQVRAEPVEVVNHGPLLSLFGNAFAEFAGHLPTFKEEFDTATAQFGRTRPSDVAGKAMAYAGCGHAESSAFAVFDTLLDEIGDVSIHVPGLLARAVVAERAQLFPGLSDADLIASFQDYLGHELLRGFRRVLPTIARDEEPNICLAGGCALNIKWNSALRRSGLFRDVWVPPFPNDSGSALGAACSEVAVSSGRTYIEWDVYRGPSLRAADVQPGWRRLPCSPEALGGLLADLGEPIVVLQGRAELGPRALGNRSILATPQNPAMKDELNRIKGREPYRPVAPICLEATARQVFEPGTPDPYMLFDHRVRTSWVDAIPAVIHLDGTARLQTISRDQHPTIARVLQAFEMRTGIGVLCNTSANHKGRGFFPDAGSAAAWGGARYVWSEGELFCSPAAVVPQTHTTGIPR